MIRINPSDLLNKIENEDTIKLISKLDIDFLKSNKLESLYYSFPLIERIILEIYKLVPDADIEQHEQGIMKTALSIISNNDDILPEDIIKIIKKYFDEDGLRNKLFHIKTDFYSFEVSFEEINYLIYQLLVILKCKIKEFKTTQFNDIELL